MITNYKTEVQELVKHAVQENDVGTLTQLTMEIHKLAETVRSGHLQALINTVKEKYKGRVLTEYKVEFDRILGSSTVDYDDIMYVISKLRVLGIIQ